MEFRLIYHGRLPAQSSGGGGAHIEQKHSIRREFHAQLKELWRQNAFLRKRAASRHIVEEGEKRVSDRTNLDIIADEHRLSGYRFVPLVSEREGLACSLDVLFLRRDHPGNLIRSGGDIDNRIKVLFDALRKPKDNEVEKWPPAEGENPFFVLLEDDLLINEVSVTTDRLLLPRQSGESVHDVLLLIRVKTLVTNSERAYIEFYN